MNKGSIVRHVGGFAGFALVLALGVGLRAAENSGKPPFKEVYDLIRTNAVGLDGKAMNEAAVDGLLAQIASSAWLVEGRGGSPETNSTAIASSAVFDDQYGYLRVARLSADAVEQFDQALQELSSTNKLNGLVIDLRFASGEDYAAAAAVADRFIGAEQKLLEWGRSSAKSHDKTNALRWPVAVLVNRYTFGAAEALAAVLRHTDVALLIGTNTAGQASTTKDFPLSNGQVLRIATAQVKLGNGSEIKSLAPDILVEVSPDDERAYFVDAYKVLHRPSDEAGASSVASLSVTNRASRRRINEAELVRMLREGQDIEDELSRPAKPAAPAKPVVSDPALARAIDLLKALAVVRHTRF